MSLDVALMALAAVVPPLIFGGVWICAGAWRLPRMIGLASFALAIAAFSGAAYLAWSAPACHYEVTPSWCKYIQR